METFGNRLKIARVSKNLTLEQLAEMVETTKATLSRYENNKRFPDIYVTRKLANALDVNIDYLINGNRDIETIAAHIDSEEFTEDELKDIEDFKEYVRSRKKRK